MKNKGWWIGGIVVVLGVGAYLIFKKKKPATDKTTDAGDGSIKTKAEALDYFISQGINTSAWAKFDEDYLVARANAMQSRQSTFNLAGKTYDTKAGSVVKAAGIASTSSGAGNNTANAPYQSPYDIGKI